MPLFVVTGLITGNLVTLAFTPLELAILAASAILVFAAAAFFTQL